MSAAARALPRALRGTAGPPFLTIRKLRQLVRDARFDQIAQLSIRREPNRRKTRAEAPTLSPPRVHTARTRSNSSSAARCTILSALRSPAPANSITVGATTGHCRAPAFRRRTCKKCQLVVDAARRPSARERVEQRVARRPPFERTQHQLERRRADRITRTFVA